jgi:hypothetical protein
VDIGVATAIGVAVAGIGSSSVLDRVIDVTSHDHRSWAYRLAMKPQLRASEALLGAGVLLAGAGLLAGADDRTRKFRSPLLKVAAGIGVGYLAPIAVRGAWGMAVAPAQAGWKPGMQAIPGFRLDDLAGNAVSRVRMMGRDTDLTKSAWKPFDAISRWQGHGPLAERTDFAPVLRYEGVHYRTPTPAGVTPLPADPRP